MSKYKYYFRKPKSEIAKDILGLLIIGGAVAIAATSPFFIVNLLKGLKRLKKYPNKKVYDTFYKLKHQGLVDFYYKNNQIHIFLTEKGKQKAGWMQIDSLKIKKPKKWDGLWRILLFDIAEKQKMHREALRGKLIELGFKLFQKSAWVVPYECKSEIDLLKSFFGLSDREIKLIVSMEIERGKEWEKAFNLV